MKLFLCNKILEGGKQGALNMCNTDLINQNKTNNKPLYARIAPINYKVINIEVCSIVPIPFTRVTNVIMHVNEVELENMFV